MASHREVSRFVGALLFTGLLVAPLLGQDSLQIAINPGSVSTPPSGQVLADTSDDLQGYVIAVTITSADPANGAVEVVAGSLGVTPNVDALSPDLVVPQISANGFTLGVVFETGPTGGVFSNPVIPANAGIPLAEFGLNVTTNPSSGSVPVTFALEDGVLGSPLLDNVLVQDGMSLSAGQGNLALGAPAVLNVNPLPPGDLAIVTTSGSSEDAVAVPVTLSTDAPVQGFALAIENAAGATLQSIERGADTQPGEGNTEFFQPQIFANGGTVGAVLDFSGPTFANQTLTGQDLEIARYVYTSDAVIFDPDPANAVDVNFVDGALGTPALDNILVINNQSITPNISNGQVIFEPVAPGLQTTYVLGGKSDTIDLLQNELPPITGVEGGEVEVGLYYSREFPIDPNAPDAENSNIQGFQFVICFPEELEFRGFTVEGGILAAVGAEFVNTDLDPVSREIEIQCDPEQLPLADDANPLVETTFGRDLAIAVLLDVLPPFEGQTAPATPIAGQVLLAGCLTFGIADDGVLQTDPGTGLEFCEEKVKIGFCLEPSTINDDDQAAPELENLISVDFGDLNTIVVVPTEICVENVAEFRRGDCTDNDLINIADAALILGLQFSNDPAATTNCEDACDVNDDGKINLADAVSLLFYLFKDGTFPPQPFWLEETVDGVTDFAKDADNDLIPDEGPDPTDDGLDCDTDIDCIAVE